MHVPCGERWWEPREMSLCEGGRDRLSLSKPGPTCQMPCLLSNKVKERADWCQERSQDECAAHITLTFDHWSGSQLQATATWFSKLSLTMYKIQGFSICEMIFNLAGATGLM